MQQIQSFLSVCDQKSFTKASEQLYTSQPVISRQVSSLENELGFKLFVRNNHGDIKLTEQGEVYADFMRRFLNDYGEMLESVDKTIKLNMGFCSERTPDPAVQKAVNKMWKKHGFEAVSISFMTLSDLHQAISEESIDIAYVDERVIMNSSKPMATTFVRSARARMLLSEQHPLARKENLSKTDFIDSTFIRLESWLPPNSEPVDQVTAIKREVSKKTDAKKQKYIFAPDGSTLLLWCKANRGVAVMLIWNDADFNLSQCVLRDVPELGSENEVLAWHKDNKNPLVSEFLKIYKECRKQVV
jgi:DNA-binding transcriptional LysR family regulator